MTDQATRRTLLAGLVLASTTAAAVSAPPVAEAQSADPEDVVDGGTP